MDTALQALRMVDFDWTAHIDQIWDEGPLDVSSLQREARAELYEHIEALSNLKSKNCPLGIPLIGAAGSGKTHLLGVIRRAAIAKHVFFVLADMTDVRDFWETLALGCLRSLQKESWDNCRQIDAWLKGIIRRYGANVKKADSIPRQRPPGLIITCNELIAAVRKENREQAQEHEDVLRALTLFACDDADINDLGYKWLLGIGIDDEEKQHHGFREAQRSPQRIVRGLSWLLSLEAPTVLALDQLDAIVAEHNLATSAVTDEPSIQQQASLAIIQGIAGGLIALRDVARSTLTIVSTLQATWKILEQRASVSMVDRFEPPIHLDAVNPPSVVKSLVVGRLRQAYDACGFAPQYPTYPFSDQFFEKYKGNTAREVLKACDAHRRVCKKSGVVQEATASGSKPLSSTPPPNWENQIQVRLDELCKQADIQGLFEDKTERALDVLIETACNALVIENPLTTGVLAQVDKDFQSTGTYDPLHARIRLILTDQGERELHHSFRFIQLSQHRAFQSRLKAAITASGIDHALSFRHLTILRCGPMPGGAATDALVKELRERGGQLLEPTERELRTLWALSQMFSEASQPDHLDEWLMRTRPVSKMASFSSTVAWLFEGRLTTSSESTAHTVHGGDPSKSEHSIDADMRQDTSAQLELGKRLVSGKPQDAVAVALGTLAYHTCVLAGSGSGKTVFLRRMVEEAALVGVPSIVIDGANDLSRLGDPWPHRPPSWTDEDAEKSERYHQRSDVVVWTPGLSSGNPLVFNPLPDFASLVTGEKSAELRDQLDAAVAMAQSSLEPLIAPGKGAKDKKSRAVLADALRHFAERGGSEVRDLIELLRDPPDDVVEGYQGGTKIAQEISELLLSATKTDVMLRGAGTQLNPAVLFRGRDPSKVRVSVINLSGLPGQETQQKFVNQLAMTLFTWIKKNPAKPGSLLGLLIVDEAKDFVPANKAAPSRDNLLRLAAQARKYGLGLLFATQTPKSIDHNIVANCSTLLVGRTNSPAAIEAVQQLLRDKGGSGDDVAKLALGTFYLSSVAQPKPAKIATPLCLSYHPSTPPDEREVVERARRTRET